MKIGVLGTGMVGQTIGRRLVELGHQVRLGARSRDNERATSWAAALGSAASTGTFAEAAAFGEVLFNCTNGASSLDALELAGAAQLEGKLLVDVANPLDFSKGMPPTLLVSNTDSLGEQIQRRFPGAKVVKALNTMNCSVMVDPRQLPDSHHVFMAGNDSGAKAACTELLRAFGWRDEEILDLGDISAARGTEAALPLWLRIFGAVKSGTFNFKVVLGG